MSSKTVSTFAFCFLLSALAALPQGKIKKLNPDMSGTWTLDHEKSNVSEIGKANTPIKIVYREPELRITRTFIRDGQDIEREFVYYTDGRGEVNPATMTLTTSPDGMNRAGLDKQSVKSKTTWKSDKIVIKANLQLRTGRDAFDYLLIEEWKLAADGQTLMQTDRFEPDRTTVPVMTPAPRPDDKRVYKLLSK